MTTDATIRAVAHYLMAECQSPPRWQSRSPAGAVLTVEGEPFWIAVARVAVALGATATMQPLHGPVSNLGDPAGVDAHEARRVARALRGAA